MGEASYIQHGIGGPGDRGRAAVLEVQLAGLAAGDVVLGGAEPGLAGKEAAWVARADKYAYSCSVEARKGEKDKQRGEKDEGVKEFGISSMHSWDQFFVIKNLNWTKHQIKYERIS